MKFQLLLVALLLGTILCAQSEYVVWQDNGIPIRQGENIEWSRAADVLTDGNIVYVWSDTKLGDRDLWAQKMNSDGDRLWGDTPVLIDNKIDRQEDPVIIATTDGGCIVAWVEFANEIGGDIYAQKLDTNGNRQWAEGGVPLCTATGIQISLNIVPDTSGGAFIIWLDSRNAGGADIYGVHVDASGSNLWAEDGIVLAGGEGEQSGHTFWEDGQGGAIMAYINSYLSETDLYVLRVLGDGTIAWTTTLCDADMEQVGVKMCKTGTDTFGFAWRDHRNDNGGDIYAQACDINGNLLWNDEVLVYAEDLVQENPRVTSNGDGNMFVAWQDTHLDGYYTDCYVQKMDSNGNLLWNDGVVLSDESFHQWNPRLVAGDNGDVYVVWDDGRQNGHPHEDIYMQHVLSNGTPEWEEDGRVVCNADWEQFSVLIKRSADHIFVNWGDFRTGSIGLYLQVLDMNGNMLLEDGGEEFYWGLSGDATDALLIPDGNNAYSVWVDTRYAVTGTRVFTQKILGGGNGEVGFTANGIPFTVDVNADQKNPKAVLHTGGGIVAVWHQLMEGTERVYCQALDASGNSLWNESGLSLSNASLNQEYPAVSEVNGEYYFGWSNMEQDGWDYFYRLYGQKVVNGSLQWGDTGVVIASQTTDLFMIDIVGPYYLFQTSQDVYVTKLNADGTPATGFETPLVLCNATGIQKNPKGELVDGDLFVIWEDKRDGSQAVFGQLVHANGTVAWTENGVAIASYVNDQYNPALSYDGTDFYVAWSDFRNGNDEDVVMQKVSGASTGNGELLWNTDGLFVVEKDSVQFTPSLITSQGNQFITWADFFGPASDIYMQKLYSDSTKLWGDNGAPLCDAIMNQYEPHVVPIDGYYALAIWRDARSSGKTEISGMYAQKIWTGAPGTDDEDVPATVSLEQNWPNPFNPETTIAFSLLNPGDVRLDIYNIRGQKVKTLVNEQLTAGRHAFVWHGTDDNGNDMGSGIYLYRLSSDNQVRTRRMILLK